MDVWLYRKEVKGFVDALTQEGLFLQNFAGLYRLNGNSKNDSDNN